jgi:hypothetical protein
MAVGAIARELGVRYLLMGKVRWGQTGEDTRVQGCVYPELWMWHRRRAHRSLASAFDAVPPSQRVREVAGDIATQVAEKWRFPWLPRGARTSMAAQNNVEDTTLARGLRYWTSRHPDGEASARVMTQATYAGPRVSGRPGRSCCAARGAELRAHHPLPDSRRNMELAFGNAARLGTRSPTHRACRFSMLQAASAQDIDSFYAGASRRIRRAPNDARLRVLLGIMGRSESARRGGREQLQKAARSSRSAVRGRPRRMWRVAALPCDVSPRRMQPRLARLCSTPRASAHLQFNATRVGLGTPRALRAWVQQASAQRPPSRGSPCTSPFTGT